MRILKRILAMTLAVLMLPIVALPVSAELATYGEQNFDKFLEGGKLTSGHGFGRLPNHYEVKSEGDGKYLRVPFVGGEDSGNWDSSLVAKHTPLNSGDSFTVEVSYRPHYNAEVGGVPTVEAQFQSYTFYNPNNRFENGIYMNLYVIDLTTGMLSGCGKVVEGAKGLVADEWNTVKMVFYPSNCTFRIFVNDELYSVQDSLPCVASGFSATYYGGCTDAKIDGNQFIVAKCNKKKGAYVEEAKAAEASYIDVDNIRIYETEKVNYTLNGEERTIGRGSIMNLAPTGKQLLWASVETADGEKYSTNDPWISIEEGMKIDAAVLGFTSLRAEARTCTPLGIRFLTQVDLADLDALKAREDVANIEMGTLIIPTLSIGGLGKLTFETVQKFGYMNLSMKDWYRVDEAQGVGIFAGSVANIKEENFNRQYSGVGYAIIHMTSGEEVVVYGSDALSSLNTTSYTAAAKKSVSSGNAQGAARRILKNIMEYYEDDVMKLYGNEMKGLNVLAFGDSLFSGTIGYPQSSQWVNKLGLDCGWNLTNLGIGSMTVSWTERNNVDQWGSKNSMYDWYFNNKHDFRWGTKAVGVSPNPFFNCGDISGNPEDVDMIILEGGCNDYGTAIGAPLGTLDSKDPGTFLGAWNCMTERLMEDYPNATIVFLTTWRLPPQSRHLDTLTSVEYSESVIDLYNEKYAENQRIALIDAGNPAVSGVDMLDSNWRSTYSTDSYHLKDTGMAIMANNMLPLLWQIAKNTGKID